ncbi:hypothetical protein BH11BAC4_BH11BAC4_12990 [soil metagenome]
MKKIYLSLIITFSLFAFNAAAQTVKGTIADKGGSTIGIYGQSNASLNNVLFRNINITFSIADQGAGNPTNAQIVSTPAIANLDLVPVNTFGGNPYLPGNGRAYYSYIMSDNGLSTTTTWPANRKDNLIADFTFPAVSSAAYFSTLRLDDVSPNGGPNLQMYWYVEIIGPGDITDYSNMFFGTPSLPPTNNSGVSPSFVPLQPITVVPVRFTGFTVTKSTNDAILKWDVTNEDANTDRYELERSVNGVDFINFATVQKNTVNSANNSYTSTDADISGRVMNRGIVYYRVKQVDKDGRFVYTEIRNIRFSGTKGFDVNVFPNPVKDIATVNIDLSSKAEVFIIISDATGKEMQKITLDAAVGGNTKQVNMRNYAAGTYLFKIKAGEENKVVSVVKTK